MRRQLAKAEVAGVHRLEAWAVEKTMEAKVVVKAQRPLRCDLHKVVVTSNDD